jgi:hypothetical protein
MRITPIILTSCGLAACSLPSSNLTASNILSIELAEVTITAKKPCSMLHDYTEKEAGLVGSRCITDDLTYILVVSQGRSAQDMLPSNYDDYSAIVDEIAKEDDVIETTVSGRRVLMSKVDDELQFSAAKVIEIDHDELAYAAVVARREQEGAVSTRNRKDALDFVSSLAVFAK